MQCRLAAFLPAKNMVGFPTRLDATQERYAVLCRGALSPLHPSIYLIRSARIPSGFHKRKTTWLPAQMTCQMGGAPGAEPSARERVCGSGAAACAAGRRPAPLHGQFNQAHLPHLPAHEGERSTQDEAALRGGRGASSDSPHHLRRAILLIRLAGGQGRRAISSEAKQRGAKGSGGGQGRRQESRRGRRAVSENQNKNKLVTIDLNPVERQNKRDDKIKLCLKRLFNLRRNQ